MFEFQGWVNRELHCWQSSNTVSLLLLIITVVNQVLVIVVVQVEHVVCLLPVAVVVHQRFGDVCFVDACFERVEVALRVWNVVEIDNLAIWLGMANFDADSAS